MKNIYFQENFLILKFKIKKPICQLDTTIMQKYPKPLKKSKTLCYFQEDSIILKLIKNSTCIKKEKERKER